MSELVSSRIHLLPEHLVDQIKAGEVIERPANLIKEILENSLDAQSRNISIHLVAAGMELISIEDDGDGMSFGDLPYAFCRHATSKIDKFEDLYSLGSYGFRGEALASIASISRVTCVSHEEKKGDAGGRIVIHAGATQSHQKLDTGKKGTSLFIKDLFFNTPARLKFIKSATSEKNALRRVLLSFILTHPKTTFTIKWDDQDKRVYPVLKDIKKTQEQRIGDLFNGKNKVLDFHSFSTEYEDHKVQGFFSRGSSKGSSYKKHFLFVNNRLFTDRQIHQTILRSMESLYPSGGSGHYVVYLQVPPNLIDVNVHPHKTLIKFYKIQIITGLLSSEIKKLHSASPLDKVFDRLDEPLTNHSKNLQESSQLFSSHYEQNLEERSLKQKGENYNTHVSSRLAIVDISGKAFLLDKLNFLALLKAHTSYQQEDSDNEFIPLLITEPFTSSALLPEVKKELRGWGFLCDVAEDATIMLRAYHPIYELDFAKKLIKNLIESTFDLKEDSVADLVIPGSFVEQAFKEKSISDQKDNCLRPVNSETFKTIFGSSLQ